MYLWYKQDAAATSAVVDVKVLYDGEDKPEGYKRASRDLAKGTDKKINIAFKVAELTPECKEQPICEIVIVYDEESPGEDWEKVERSLNGAGNPVFMWVKRGAMEDDKWDPEALEVGDVVDCQDSVRKWCVATVVERKEDKVRIRYKGWGARWDDTLPVTSNRIAKAGTKNAQAGPKRVKQGDDWPIEEKEIVDYEEKVSDLLAGKFDEETAAKVENVQLLDWVERNMQANHVPEESKDRVNDSFKRVYEVICWRLKRFTHAVPKPVMAMWNQLMLGDTKAYWFFQKGGGCVPDSDLGRAVAGEFGRLPPSGASRFFVDNINKFGQEGGFEAALERLAIRDVELSPISEVLVMTKLLSICRYCYNPDFAKPYFTKYIPAFLDRIRFVDNDAVKDLDQKLAEQVVRELEALMKHLTPELDIDDMRATVQLNIISRVLNCEYMTKRLTGLKSLGELCDKASAMAHRHPDASGLFTPDALATWIVDREVLPSLMGLEVRGKTHHTHVEIIKKLAPLIKFLARQGKVDSVVLDQLWAPLALANPGDSTTRAIFDLISKLSVELNVGLMDQVFEKIASIPRENIDSVALDLIQRFTAIGLTKAAGAVRAGEVDESEQRWYGIDLLWQLVQDDSEVSEKTSLAAQGILIKLTSSLQPCRPLIPLVLERCMENLNTGVSVVPALQVAQALIKAMPVFGRGSAAPSSQTRQDVLDDLQSRFDLVARLTADIATYKSQAREVAAERDGPLADEILVGRHSHKVQLEARLEFLRFHLDDSAAELTFDDVKSLWLSMCTDPIDEVDMVVFFDWLRRARFNDDNQAFSSTSCQAFSDDVVNQVFEELLCNSDYLSPETCPEAGFQTLFAFFCFVNASADKMDARGSPPVVRDPDLQGLDIIWDLALQAGNVVVRNDATQALLDLHVKVAPTVDKKVVWGKFVEQCMHRVGSHLEAAGPAAERNIESLLRVLKSFLKDVERSGLAAMTTSYTIYLHLPGSYHTAATLQIPANPDITVRELRQAVADARNHPANQVRLETFTCKVLHADTHNDLPVNRFVVSRALEAHLLNEPEPSTVNHEPPVVATEDLDEDRRYPRELLTANYFDTLFDILALRNAKVVQDTWQLLSLLPVNTDIKRDIHTMRGSVESGEAVPWEELLDRHSVLKLLYALQIVNQEVEEDASLTAADVELQRQWCEKFMALGGFSHLYSILMACDIADMVSGPLSKKCLALLLKLVNFFMVVPDQFKHLQSTKEVPDDIDYSGLVTRLMQLMRETSRSAARVVAVEERQEIVVDTTNEGAEAAAAAKGGTSATQTAGATGGTETATQDEGTTENNKKPVSVEANVVRHTIHLLVAIVSQRPNLLDDLYAVTGISEAFVFGVLQTVESSVREEVANGILSLCGSLSRARLGDSSTKTPREFFLPLLFDELTQVYKYPRQSETYLNLLKKLVTAPAPKLHKEVSSSSTAGAGTGVGAGADAIQLDLTDDLGGLNPNKAIETLATMLKEHPVVEASPDDDDPVIRGLLNLTGALVSNRPSSKLLAGSPDGCDLCAEVFTNGLFAIPNADSRGHAAPPKCKSKASRRAAFDLLVELARDCPENHSQLCSLTLPHHTDPRFKPKKVVKQSYWDFDSASAPKSSTGYAGLKNLGCICYMNATNQNFFMVPKFRHGVLQFEDEEDDKSESVMYQLQRMFANLQETERKFYNPKPFTVALKDMGEPTNVLVQKDASEYLGNLFMQIESQIQGTNQEKLIKNVFGGVLSNELLAEGNHYSQRAEPFSFLSVNVKNITTLETALKDYISGDQVDYRWEEPDGSKKELPTKKRTSIKLLPPHLIVHLKRFEFDYATLRQKKLNTRFEFPTKLNMKPYTVEGRPDKAGPKTSADEAKEEAVHPDEYYQYELMGVVVHTGTCDSGHYYSFIKERDPKYVGDGDDHRRWFQFNDTRVTPFAESMLERECFGGEETYGGTYSSGTTYQRSRNAFVLFYDRVPSRLNASESTEVAGEGAGSASTEVAKPTNIGAGIRAGVVASKMLMHHRARKAMLANRGLIPPDIFKEIWGDNMEFWHKKNVFDPNYFNFIKELSAVPQLADVEYPDDGIHSEEEANAKGGPAMQVVNLATAFVLETLVESKDRAALPQWVKKIKDLYKSNIVACVWLLQSLMMHRTKLRSYLLEGEQTTRAAIADIVSLALGRVAEYERRSYPDPAHPPTPAPISRKAGVAESKEGATEADSKTESDSKISESKEEVFTAAPRQVAITFVETMLAMLPEASKNWKAFQQFFKVLGDFANLGAPERGYLLGRSLTAILLDFVLGPDSPHPELSGGAPLTAETAKDAKVDGKPATDGDDDEDSDAIEMSVVGTSLPTSSVRPMIGPLLPPAMRSMMGMGNSTSRPNFAAVFDLLKPLVFACKPPSSVATSSPSPHQQPPCTALPELDAEMLTCNVFVLRLMRELTSTRMLRTIKPLLEHLCWEDTVLSNKFIDAIRENIKTHEHSSDLKPSFRAIVLLSNLSDSRGPERLTNVLTAVLDEMKANSNYYLATDSCICLLMRVAKHNEVVRTWLANNTEVWNWVGEWLAENEVPPQPSATPAEEGAMTLHKPTQPQQAVPADRPAHIAANVARLLSGEEFVNDGYDSDDEPEVLIGMEITVRWQGNQWYPGICEAYNPADGQHFVHYGDGDKKWYILDNKTWNPVGRTDKPWHAKVVSNLTAAAGAVNGVTTCRADGTLYTIGADVVVVDDGDDADAPESDAESQDVDV